MKRLVWVLLMGTVLLSLCCCTPQDREALATLSTLVPAAALEVSPSPEPTPAPTPTAIPVPVVKPTATPEPTPTPEPAVTPEPTPTPEPTATPIPATERSEAEIVEEMAAYFIRYGDKATEKLDALLAEMGTAFPASAQKWAGIMDRWRTLEERVTVNKGVLPDGLPDTDELCIVVLGYQLNANGTMKNHLKARLNVAIKSAKKYPNAYILCTGGGTASRKKSATEAGKMGSYLRKNGVNKARIIEEKESRTTAQNARYTLALLERDYPGIRYLAIVSGDYHVRVGVLLFEAEAILRAAPGEEPRFTVVSNAGCKTSNPELVRMFQAGGLVELAGNGKVAHALYYNTYNLKQWPPLS